MAPKYLYKYPLPSVFICKFVEATPMELIRQIFSLVCTDEDVCYIFLTRNILHALLLVQCFFFTSFFAVILIEIFFSF